MKPLYKARSSLFIFDLLTIFEDLELERAPLRPAVQGLDRGVLGGGVGVIPRARDGLALELEQRALGGGLGLELEQ